jgi:transcriptional regulator with XRE-family HTH domain
MGRWVTSPAYRTIPEVLVEARLAAGLTQRALAERLGKARMPSYIAKIETGERRIDLIEFVAIIRALGQDEQDAFRKVLERLPASIDL